MSFFSLRHTALSLSTLTLLAALLLSSCDEAGTIDLTRGDDFDKEIVINEVMASNRTGLLAADGNLYDWVEVKNVSDKAISLADYALATVKYPKDKSAKKKKKGKKGEEAADSVSNENTEKHHMTDAKGKKDKKDKKDKANAPVVDSLGGVLLTWDFPKMELAPGECILVFASKLPENSTDKELHASFKLGSKNGVVQLIKKGKYIMSEAKYGDLNGDQCLRRLTDGSYEKSYMQTPGTDNDAKGYEAYNVTIEKQRKSPLRIWELQAKGKKHETWIELQNTSNTPINLQEYCLTTKPTKADRWQFPNQTLQPGERYVVDCGKANFKIKGSCCVLLLKGEQFMDGLCSHHAPYGVTMGRVEGKQGFFYFTSPTRNEVNTSKAYRFIVDKPQFSELPGVYAEKKSLQLKINTHGYTVHYTLDGSEPTKDSPIYKDAIRIDSSCVVRAFCEGDSTSMSSHIATATYLIGQEHDLAVMCISVNHNDLYDYRSGIYVSGPGGGGPYPHEGANYWKKWWKKAHVEFFDGKEGFQADCGLAIFGGFSRTLEKKSFKIKFNDKFGPSKVTYDFFGDGQPLEFKNLVLRSGSQDMGGVMVRDEFFTSLMQSECPTLLTQKYRPVALYINGSYFGLYYIREKIDKHFVARKLNTTNDSISIIMSKGYCEEGTKTKFTELMNFARNNDLSKKENYDRICQMIDINSVIDQKIGEIYASNVDVGNIRYVRSDDANSDKKWYIVYYDLDLTWSSSGTRPASFFLRPGDSESSIHNVLVGNLLKNSDFRQLFLQRLSHHLHKTISANNATKVFDGITGTIKQEMKLNCKRWPKLLVYEKWEKNLADFKEKINKRDKEVLDDLRKELAITPEENKKYFGDLE